MSVCRYVCMCLSVSMYVSLLINMPKISNSKKKRFNIYHRGLNQSNITAGKSYDLQVSIKGYRETFHSLKRFDVAIQNCTDPSDTLSYQAK